MKMAHSRRLGLAMYEVAKPRAPLQLCRNSHAHSFFSSAFLQPATAPLPEHACLRPTVACGTSRRLSASVDGVPELLRAEMVGDGVAVVTMLELDGEFSWGTRIFEHRLNTVLLRQLNAALDQAEAAGMQALVVTGEGGFFCNGMDLQYIRQNAGESLKIQTEAEKVLSRILTLGVPTICALNGHWTAAGAMLGLAFDQRVMASNGDGLFFVPGIDIGLVYSAGMTELMKSKMPLPMWNHVMCYARRYQCDELLKAGVVDAAPHSSELLPKAIEIATEMKSKGGDAKTRETLHGIKKKLYKDAVALLGCDVEDMGFATGTFDATGRAAKN